MPRAPAAALGFTLMYLPTFSFHATATLGGLCLALFPVIPAERLAWAEQRGATAATSRLGAPAGKQELGAHLGLAAGGRVTPGGARFEGTYLYRLAHRDWAEVGVAFSFGTRAPGCFADRRGLLACDHSYSDGFAAELLAGVRHFFPGQGAFNPYLRAGLALRAASFAGDDVHGVASPFQLGGGVRARVASAVAVLGEAIVLAGPAWFNSGLAWEPQFSFVVASGVEFQIDQR